MLACVCVEDFPVFQDAHVNNRLELWMEDLHIKQQQQQLNMIYSRICHSNSPQTECFFLPLRWLALICLIRFAASRVSVCSLELAVCAHATCHYCTSTDNLCVGVFSIFFFVGFSLFFLSVCAGSVWYDNFSPVAVLTHVSKLYLSNCMLLHK